MQNSVRRTWIVNNNALLWIAFCGKKHPIYYGGWNPAPPDHSLLVQIFLWEKDAETAWREAQNGGCHDSWWLELARLREKQFPADVIPIYQRRVETLINEKSNSSYTQAVKLLRKIRDLMAQQQWDDRFSGYLDGVLSAHKPKRNFMKLAARL